jgi:hypothetical protein
MKCRFILCFALIFSGISISPGQPPSIPPPPPGPDLPGRNNAKIEAYWLAPYVRVSNGFGLDGTRVTWFAADGKVKKQTVVSSIEPGFVTIPGSVGRGERILAVNEDWEIALPPEPTNIQSQSKWSLSGYITSTADSRVFVHQYHPKGGWIALDIYVHGKLANTVGPFVQHPPDEVNLNEDGSASLLIWENEFRTNAQIVTLSTNGEIRSRENYGSSVAASGGKRFHPAAKSDLGPNAYCIGWIPGTHKSLYATSVGFDYHYELVDEDTGKLLWKVPCPGPDGGDAQSLAIGLDPKFVIFSVAEPYASGPWRGPQWVFRGDQKEWIRAFYAINVDDGRIAARWQADYPQRLDNDDRERFLRLGNKLFYMKSDAFTEINFEDIAAKTNGWK